MSEKVRNHSQSEQTDGAGREFGVIIAIKSLVNRLMYLIFSKIHVSAVAFLLICVGESLSMRRYNSDITVVRSN